MFVRFSSFLFATMAFVPGAFAAFNQAAQIVAGALLFSNLRPRATASRPFACRSEVHNDCFGLSTAKFS